MERTERGKLIEQAFEDNKEMIKEVEKQIFWENFRSNFTLRGLRHNAWGITCFTFKYTIFFMITYFILNLLKS